MQSTIVQIWKEDGNHLVTSVNWDWDPINGLMINDNQHLIDLSEEELEQVEEHIKIHEIDSYAISNYPGY